MTTQSKKAGIAFAIAAAAAFIIAPIACFADEAESTDISTVSCYGVNSCKGHSVCKSSSNACKGLNACKGQGMEVVDSAKDCTDQGGTVESGQ
jgi:hypothetical protein